MVSSDRVGDDMVSSPVRRARPRRSSVSRPCYREKGLPYFAARRSFLEAAKVGLSLRPTQLLIFGNPNAGTLPMQTRQTIGLDSPLRVLIWEDEAGSCAWLTYAHPLQGIARRHGITGNDPIIAAIDDGLAALVKSRGGGAE